VIHVFDRLESEVRSYCRDFPVVFDTARGPYLYDVGGREYIDFFCGAGTLNYGHNDPGMKRALIDYLEIDGVVHGLDMFTRAKAGFLERFDTHILAPRRLQYRIQFTGPTGANAVEAALKLARKITGRRNVIAFTHAYHGLSLGALATTANAAYRHEAFVNRGDVAFVPYDGYLGPHVNTADYLARVLDDASSGVDRPAAVIVETIQGEGGINVASPEWLRAVQAVCRRLGILLIVDDIQVGCGRTGTFFSFEHAGLDPDLVILSKSISGFGLPMSLLLIRPSLDQWRPGEHTGTFRGNNAAFVTAAQALRFWENDDLTAHIASASRLLEQRLAGLQARRPELQLQVRGRGLVYGLESAYPTTTGLVAAECFTRGLVIETCGGARKVIKILPPLTVPLPVLTKGLDLLEESFEAVLAHQATVAGVKEEVAPSAR